MGIFINLLISKSVTKEEWEAVYEETLELIKHLPFAEVRTVKIHDIGTTCLVKTEERTETKNAWGKEEIQVGWMTNGDLYSLQTAESYYLPRDIIAGDVEPDAGDAMLGALPAYMHYKWEDHRFRHVYEKWGMKTQGEPYHIGLLAVAALIEARLGTKAFTYGDITRGQFRRAVEIVNEYVESPIEMPDRCNMDSLAKRVRNLPLTQMEQLAAFDQFFLGTKDAEFGEFMRSAFSADTIGEYWRDRFSECMIDTDWFDRSVSDYLLWGFELEDLCKYVKLGENDYEEFIKRIMDAKLHIKDKDCKDSLKIDQEAENPYSVATLLAQFAFRGCHNMKVDRYIPIDVIRKVFSDAFSGKCDTDSIIDNYLSEEAKQIKIHLSAESSSDELSTLANQDPADALNQTMKIAMEQWKEKDKEYDVTDHSELLHHEDGDTILPAIEESLIKLTKFLETILDDEYYAQHLAEGSHNCCKWLSSHNRNVLIRDVHWDKVYTDIEGDINSFGRYYSLLTVKLTSKNVDDMVTALFVNDDLYNYVKRMAAERS